MKSKIFFITILLVTWLSLMAMQTAKPVKIIFFGDSITEIGVQPGGYIDKMRRMLKDKNVSNYQLTGTDADKFEKFYVALIRKLQANGIQVALCTPAVIGEKTDGKNELDDDLNKFSQIIRNLAGKYGLPLCDLRRIFMDYLAQNNGENKEKGVLTNDGVHLNDAGNQLVAEHVLKIIMK